MRKIFREHDFGNGLKSVLTIPWTVEQLIDGQAVGKDRVRRPKDAYRLVSLVYRAVRLRCNTLTNVPVHVIDTTTGDDIEHWAFEDSLSLDRCLWQSEAALLIAGANYLVKARTNEGYAQAGLQWVNPQTMSVAVSQNQLVFRQQQTGVRSLYGGTSRTWSEDEVIYMREFDIDDDVAPGIAPAAVSLPEAQLRYYLSWYAAKFFEGGAMPITLINVKGKMLNDERERVESFFTKAMKTAKRVIGLAGDIEAKILTPEFKSFDIDKLGTYAVEGVSWAFDIPKTVLTSESANYATADVEYKSFISGTIQSRCKYYESMLNPTLAEFNQKLVFDIQELSVMQEDESNRAAAFKMLVDGGMSKQLAAAVLGFDIPEDFAAEWEADTTTTTQTQTLSGAAAGSSGVGVNAVKPEPVAKPPAPEPATKTATPPHNEARLKYEKKLTAATQSYFARQRKHVQKALVEATARSAEKINVTVEAPIIVVPETKMSDVHVHVPQQGAPSVDVHVPEAKAAPITVNVPQQAAAVVTVNVPETTVHVQNDITVPAANVEVNIPEEKKRDVEVIRDSSGRIKKLKEK